MEGRKIYLVQRTVVYDDIDIAAIVFLIVKRIMFDAGGNTIFLYTLYVGYHHLRGEIRVFTHVFKVTTIERCAIYIHARAQQHCLVAIAGFLAYAHAVKMGNSGIPGGGETGECGECNARVIGPVGTIPFIPKHFSTYAVRTVGSPYLRDT